MLLRRNPPPSSASHQGPRDGLACVSPNAHSPAPGLQKQPVRSEMPAARRVPGDRALVDHAPVRVEEVERDGAAAAAVVGRAVEPDQRRAVAVLEPAEVVEQPRR